MPVRTFRGKRGRPGDRGTDRAIATAVVLGVTMVLLVIGFSGPSLELRLPGFEGWIYISVVIGIATVVLVWLFCAYGRQKSSNPP